MNLFEPAAAQEILTRMDGIKANTPANWGKMNAAQMMAHCQAPFRSYFGETKMKRGLMGILFGKMAKKKLFSDKPWPKGLPTDKSFIVTEEKEFDIEKAKLIDCINHFTKEGYTITACTHPFFGKMSSQEWAVLGYKHMDHHLKQFGV
jgi:hypothetical protein